MGFFSWIRGVVDRLGPTLAQLKERKKEELVKIVADERRVERILKKANVKSGATVKKLEKKLDSLLLRENLLRGKGYIYIGKDRMKFKLIHFAARIRGSISNSAEINRAVKKYKKAILGFAHEKFDEAYIDELEAAENTLTELFEQAKEDIRKKIDSTILTLEKTRQKALSRK